MLTKSTFGNARQELVTHSTFGNARQELVTHILLQTGGALLVPVACAGKLIGGWHEQTTYKKIRHAQFPLPILKINRHLFCRVHDLASLLTGGAIDPLTFSSEQKTPAPSRGLPKKYTDPASASLTNLVKARAAKKAAVNAGAGGAA